MVTRDQYTSCRLDLDAPTSYRWLFGCSAPKRRNIFSIFVTPFSPHPFGLEFQPGQDYYFISPSSGFSTGMKDSEGGLCRSMNMKMVLRVAGNKVDERVDAPFVDDSIVEDVVHKPVVHKKKVLTEFFHPNHHRFAGKGAKNAGSSVMPQKSSSSTTPRRHHSSSKINADVKVIEILNKNGDEEIIVDVQDNKDAFSSSSSSSSNSVAGWRRHQQKKLQQQRLEDEEARNRIPESIDDMFDTRRRLDDDNDDGAVDEELEVISNRISSYGGSGAYVIDVITPQRRVGDAASSASHLTTPSLALAALFVCILRWF